MPRGFLIKRKKHLTSSWRKLVLSEDERSETGSTISDQEIISDPPHHGSPDSGFSQSPVNNVFPDTFLDQSIYRKHFAKEWLHRNDVRKLDFDRPSSVESSDVEITSTKDIENSNVVLSEATKKIQVEDANGNDIKKFHGQNDIQFQQHKLHEFNNNINNNQDPFALYNRNLTLNRYAVLYSHKNGMPVSLPPSPGQTNLSVNTSMYGASMYWSAFNRLALSSPQSEPSPLASPASTVSSIKSPGNVIGPPPPLPPLPPQVSLNSPVKSISSPGKRKANQQTPQTETKLNKIVKRPKSARKISFEEEFKSSPVSGTYIKDVDENTSDGIRVVSGDIDSSMNCVEITPEAEAELAKIENKIGDFICKLCKEYHENAFSLAQHRCSRIVHVEYRCPECNKVFNCPANLASHRRWHKPKNNGVNGKNNSSTNQSKSATEGGLLDLGKGDSSNKITAQDEGLFGCEQCGKKFRRQAYLKKHLASHLPVQQQHQTQQPQKQENLPTWPCHFCGRLFMSESERAKHLVQHHSTSIETAGLLNCGVCSAAFTDPLALEQHQRCHTVSDIFSCKYCPETFYSIYGLGRHMYKCHPSESRQAMLLQLPPLSRPC